MKAVKQVYKVGEWVFSAAKGTVMSAVSYFMGKEEEPMMETFRMELKPVSKFATPFISISENATGKPIKHVRTLRMLIDLRVDVNKRLQNHLKKQLVVVQGPTSVKTLTERHANFLITLFNENNAELRKARCNNFEEAIAYIDEMTSFVQKLVDTSNPFISVDADGFCSAIKRLVQTDFPELVREIKYLKHKLAIPKPRSPISRKDVLKSLTSVMDKFDSNSHYIPPTDFDWVLRDWLDDTGKSSIFDQPLMQFHDFHYQSGLDMLNDLAIEVAGEFGIPENTIQYCIIHCALSRYFYDQLSLQNEKVLGNDMAVQKFLEKAETIRNSTPRELGHTTLFLPKHWDTKICDIFEEVEELRTAISYLTESQFYNFPMDIIDSIRNTVGIVAQYSAKCLYWNKKCGGDDTAPVPPKAMNEAFTFDNFFPYVICAMSVDPPTNIIAVAIYLDVAVRDFPEGGGITHTALSIQGCVKKLKE